MNGGKDSFHSTLGVHCMYQTRSGLPHYGLASESSGNPYYFSALASMVVSKCSALSVGCAILWTRWNSKMPGASEIL